MNLKNSQELANQYYRLTEETYRKLDPRGTDFMNLGLWPADSIVSAQKQVYTTLAGLVKTAINGDNVDQIVELGCGWGGGIAVLSEAFSGINILGVNSSEVQTGHCIEKYKASQNIQFHQGFYESLQLQSSARNSVAIAVESLLHCGNRLAVFEMFQKNAFNYIGLAEILLADEGARSNTLFNPALSFAAEFSEYKKLFEQFNYELVTAEDSSSEVFAPWAKALQQLTPPLSGPHRKIKDQFIQSYTTLSDLSDQGKAKYIFYVAKKRGLNG